MFTLSDEMDRLFYRREKGKQTPPQAEDYLEAVRLKNPEDYNPIRKEIRFPILMLHLLGALPFQLNHKGLAEVRIVSLMSLYSLAVVSVMTTATVVVMSERYRIMTSTASSFGNKVLEAASIIFFIPAVAVPVTHWYEAHKKAAYINSWKHIQVEFHKVTGKPLLVNLKATTRKVKASVAIIVAVLTTLLFVAERGFVWWQGLAFAYACCLCAVCTGAWCIMCRSLMEVADAIKAELNQFLQRKKGCNYPEKLRQYKTLWLSLSDLTQEFGNALGYSYGFQMLIYFVQQVLAVYGLLAELQRGGGFDAVKATFVASAIMFTYAIFMICDCSQRATEQVGNVFQRNLQRLGNFYSFSFDEARYEISLFINAIVANPPVIKFAGFVEVNRGLIGSLMAAMVTYLVVLIQFQMTSISTCTANMTDFSQ